MNIFMNIKKYTFSVVFVLFCLVFSFLSSLGITNRYSRKIKSKMEYTITTGKQNCDKKKELDKKKHVHSDIP